jgi:hypothetical protein
MLICFRGSNWVYIDLVNMILQAILEDSSDIDLEMCEFCVVKGVGFSGVTLGQWHSLYRVWPVDIWTTRVSF